MEKKVTSHRVNIDISQAFGALYDHFWDGDLLEVKLVSDLTFDYTLPQHNVISVVILLKATYCFVLRAR